MISPNFSQLGPRPRRLSIKRYHASFCATMVTYVQWIWARQKQKQKHITAQLCPAKTGRNKLKHNSAYVQQKGSRHKHWHKRKNKQNDLSYAFITVRFHLTHVLMLRRVSLVKIRLKRNTSNVPLRCVLIFLDHVTWIFRKTTLGTN